MPLHFLTYCFLCAMCLVLSLGGSAPAQSPPQLSGVGLVQDQSGNAGDEAAKDKKDDKEKDDKDKDKKDDDKEKWYSVHGQATTILQGNGFFRSPYEGEHSLRSIVNQRTSQTATLFLDTKLWSGAEFIFNPEIAGGRGLSDVFGVAGFPNGEIPRVGDVAPTPYFARVFLRQTWGLGGEQEDIKAEENVIEGKRDIRRFTLTLGKLAANDIFDDNKYSHDTRTQFMNWSIMNNGAWDYPANTRGYTYGGAIEYNEKWWAIRYGAWGVPSTANGPEIDPKFTQAYGQVAELEYRYELNNRPGAIRFMGYVNRANMGNYNQAIEEMPVDPVIANTRRYSYKAGFGINIEQEVADNTGVFFRAGWNDGQNESWAFTEIDQTISGGVLFNGKSWGRSRDEFGVAGAINGISVPHHNYLGAGGLGFILGDGQIAYAPECIGEMYYSWGVSEHAFITGDYQFILNPAYNSDRGPVSVFSVRVHIVF
ncbi:MAG: carbohydrate porin [Gemmatales bacterium]